MPGTATTILIDGTPTDYSDPWIDSLVAGGAWTDGDGGKVTIQWTAFQGTMDGQNSYGWTSLALAGLREALSLWEAVANIDFVEVSAAANADVKFWWGTEAQAGGPGVLGWSDLPGFPTYYENPASETRDVLFNAQASSMAGALGKGSLGLVTMVHEIGHLLGLAHPHDGGAGADGANFPGVTDEFYDYGDHGLNQGIYTTMGYNQGWPTFYSGNTSQSYGLQAGPMALDIAAIQAIYGANTSYASGNNLYKLPTVNQVGTYWSSIWDTGGVDTISNEGSPNNAVIDLRPAEAGVNGGGYISHSKAQYGVPGSTGKIDGGFTIGRGVIIENATGGSGSDTITGNAAVNRLEGGMGDDILDGGTGADTMIGGAGHDRYYVDNAGDVIVETGDFGTDTVYSTISFVLAATLDDLFLIGTAHVNGTGNGLANTLTGNAGDNALAGGGGADMFDGGAGNDRIVVNDFAFSFALGGEGVDTLVLGGSGHSIFLPATTLTSKISGFERFDITGTGDNTLFLDQATVLARGEPFGPKCVLVVERDRGDVVRFADSGWSKSGSFTNSAGIFDRWVLGNAEVHIERERGEAIVGTADADIISTSATVPGQPKATHLDDVIDGAGGADTMSGGDGDDIYYADNAGDQTIESAGRGIDTVRASISWKLAGNVENLELLAGAVNGTGNSLDNRVTGNAGDNVLDGGLGADTMAGGLGNDTYTVDNAGDVLVEEVIGGTDTILSSVTWTLQANLENLALTGSSAINGTGNALDNWLTGNAGINTLTGGAGNDTYVVGVGDIVVEQAGGGTDTVRASSSFTLGANVENLVLAGAANINGTGNALGNVMTGNAGNNVLDGGVGADTMAGGLGDDTYVIDVAGDLVAEALGEGLDTADAWLGWTLGANLEQLRLMGTADLSGTGNGLNNALFGNAGKNVLNGGTGADRMAGGFGDDTYVVDVAGDVVTEVAGEGTDTVEAWLGWTLGANLERLRLLGTADLNGTGNDLDNTLYGNAGKNVLDGKAGADTMAGGLGDDTYIVDNPGDQTIEVRRAGVDLVRSSITWALATYVDNLTLTGIASINGTGNGLNNVLTGNAGNNVLDGGAGADAMAGGLGDDTYVVDNALDVVTELKGGGVDTVLSSIDWTLGARVERLTLTGTAHRSGTGNEVANTLTGNAGKNVLDGKAGADTMAGGLGDDTYIVDAAGDVAVEEANAGTDTVQSSVTWQLRANFERLVLTGSANVNGTGNELANLLTGNAGNNILDGGAGIDTMAGGLGNDTYVIDHAGDRANEDAGGGTDTVLSSLSHTLGANLEKLVLTGTAAINGSGNGEANSLTGNEAANVLDGKAGADRLEGRAGNDVYVVDDAGDVVIEAAGGGADAVQSSVDYTLAANVETLTLTGAANLNGTGNGLANVLVGNVGDNRLDGGAGADTMTGGLGNDTYVIDNAGDVVTEKAGGGIDTVLSSIAHALHANVENLVLTGTAALNGTGNAGANALTGNGGRNVLDGGLGADVLAGGGGGDTFRFSTALGPDNVDRIVLFDHTGDTIQLDDAVFAALGTGGLAAGAFNLGAVASQADDRILFDAASKSLSYDTDGLGGAAAVRFATIDTLQGVLDHTDFLIV